ncbi:MULTISPECIES: IclR family transcriptional regulator [unclassified Haloarcula]|uniref:IclR family transcriptional regulator n=1 Tax=unclassified Haloarcula TaxID=2624677 RepID=UPI0017867D3C|nr:MULTISPECIES: IclR family transcriptional regulator [unclassified Haloarcula]
MATGSSENRTVQATETAFDIVELLQEQDGAKLHEIATELDLADSTVYHHLNTLIGRRYVVREGDVYYPGLEFLQVGGRARERRRAYRLSESFVQSLAEETGEQVQFIVEENGYGYHVYTTTGEHATSIDTRPGKRIYLHANATGKAIMAFYERERVEEIIDSVGLPALTEHTITDREELFEELETVRERGYAYNWEEHVEGYCGVGVPVRLEREVLGALALGGPVERVRNEQSRERLTQRVRETVNEMELELKFDTP